MDQPVGKDLGLKTVDTFLKSSSGKPTLATTDPPTLTSFGPLLFPMTKVKPTISTQEQLPNFILFLKETQS